MPRVNGLVVAGAFVGGLVLYPPAIRSLRRLGLRQVERSDGPQSHLSKAGTPTAGGLVFCILLAAVWGLALRDPLGGVVVAAAALGGAIGLLDDLRKAHRGEGLRVRPKFVLLTVCAAILALGLSATHASVELVPGLGMRDLGWGGIALAALAMLATANAANLTDGVDGLAAGCAIPALVACGSAAALEQKMSLAVTCWSAAALILAFLFFNLPKARVFMGDAGSLAIGLLIAAAAAETGLLVLLPLLAAVFLAETLSVIAQVGYFKLTGGRRLLRMSPLHHHLELGGLSEWAIDLRLWSVSLVTAGLVVGWAFWSGIQGVHP
ncbi:MAG: phospho-N-acetylmuramoyl-pentapeptide-transferase [Candidatus Dormibacteria bacterium]